MVKDGATTYRLPKVAFNLTCEVQTDAVDSGTDRGVGVIEAHVEDVGVIVNIGLGQVIQCDR